MEQTFVISIFRDTLMTILLVAGPMLIAGLVVGVLVSIFQAVTSIREMTLTFVPKILVVGATLLLCLPWILKVLTNFTIGIFSQMNSLP